MENYAVYSLFTGFELLLEKAKEIFPESKPAVKNVNGFRSIEIKSRNSFFTGSRLLKINYRERRNTNDLLLLPTCDFSKQLLGMYHCVSRLKSDNDELKKMLLDRIETIRSEIVFIGEPKMNDEHRNFFTKMVMDLDSLVFAPPKMVLSKSKVQHFLDKSLNLLIDFNGNTGNGDLKNYNGWPANHGGSGPS